MPFSISDMAICLRRRIFFMPLKSTSYKLKLFFSSLVVVSLLFPSLSLYDMHSWKHPYSLYWFSTTSIRFILWSQCHSKLPFSWVVKDFMSLAWCSFNLWATRFSSTSGSRRLWFFFWSLGPSHLSSTFTFSDKNELFNFLHLLAFSYNFHTFLSYDHAL